MEKIKGTPEQQQYRRKLVDALRGGKYEQGQGYLRVGDNFCCLGVACDISGAGEWRPFPAGVFAFYGEKDYSTSMLPREVQALFGFTSSGNFAGEGKNFFTRRERSYYELYQLNDDGLTFDEIASLIEERFEVAPAAQPVV